MLQAPTKWNRIVLHSQMHQQCIKAAELRRYSCHTHLHSYPSPPQGHPPTTSQLLSLTVPKPMTMTMTGTRIPRMRQLPRRADGTERFFSSLTRNFPFSTAPSSTSCPRWRTHPIIMFFFVEALQNRHAAAKRVLVAAGGAGRCSGGNVISVFERTFRDAA